MTISKVVWLALIAAAWLVGTLDAVDREYDRRADQKSEYWSMCVRGCAGSEGMVSEGKCVCLGAP